jgi:hypothetical protein
METIYSDDSVRFVGDNHFKQRKERTLKYLWSEVLELFRDLNPISLLYLIYLAEGA